MPQVPKSFQFRDISKMDAVKKRIEGEVDLFNMMEHGVSMQGFRVNIAKGRSNKAIACYFGSEKLIIEFDFPTHYPVDPYRATLPFPIDHPYVTNQTYSIPKDKWTCPLFWEMLADIKPLLLRELDKPEIKQVLPASEECFSSPLFKSFSESEVTNGLGMIVGTCYGTISREKSEKLEGNIDVTDTKGDDKVEKNLLEENGRDEWQYVVSVKSGSAAEKEGIQAGWIVRNLYVKFCPDEWECIRWDQLHAKKGLSKGIMFMTPPPLTKGSENLEVKTKEQVIDDTAVENVIADMYSKGLLLRKGLRDFRFFVKLLRRIEYIFC